MSNGEYPITSYIFLFRNLNKDTWKFDDRDQLKRQILTYGYGRWKKI
jgi:hypothetical protein